VVPLEFFIIVYRDGIGNPKKRNKKKKNQRKGKNTVQGFVRGLKRKEY
jgi:hypothetical protein